MESSIFPTIISTASPKTNTRRVGAIRDHGIGDPGAPSSPPPAPPSPLFACRGSSVQGLTHPDPCWCTACKYSAVPRVSHSTRANDSLV